MKEKTNVAKLLKDCPSGMELDCMMYENLYFNSLNADYDGTINCYTLIDGIKTSIDFSKYGTFNSHKGAKCVIFPKGKTTWEGFVPPCRFKDGDVVVVEVGKVIQMFILKEIKYQYHGDDNYVGYCYFGWAFNSNKLFPEGFRFFSRLATEREKEKLFKAIKDNGYKWNAEKKTLEKLVEPKFKVGNEIVKRNSISSSWIVDSITPEYYELKLFQDSENIGVLPISEQDEWELVPKKFDITTLKPFDKVLVRDDKNQQWAVNIFGHYLNTSSYPFCCSGNISHVGFKQCIPYENNKHLLGTTNDCDEFYKNW